MSYVDPFADTPAPSVANLQNQEAQAQLRQNIQQQRALNALHGVNLNDANSVNAGLNSSIQAGALDQANALMNLNWTRNLRSQAQPLISAFTNWAKNPNQSSDQQQQTAAPVQGQPEQQSPYQGAQEVMTQAAGVVKDMQSAPDATHAQAILTARTPDLLKLGVPQEAIDSVSSHLQDQNFSQESLGQLLDHYQQHAANFGGVAQGQPPMTGLSTHLTNGWAQSLMSNPAAIGGLDIMKGAGLDFTNLANIAQQQVQPAIQKQAELQYAPALAAVDVAKAGASEIAKNVADFNTLPAVQGAVAEATAKGSGAGTLTTVHMLDGSDQRGVINYDQSGKPYLVPLHEAPAAQGQQAGPVIHGQSTAAGQVQQGSGGEYQADLQAAARSQPMQIALRKVIDLLPNTNTGPGVEVTNNWRSFIQSQLPILAPLIPGGLTEAKVQTANTNELQKYMVQIAGAQAAQYGQGTNEKLAVAASGNPHLSMDNMSALDVSRMAMALQRADNAKPYLFGTTGQDPGQYSGFASNYARTVDPRAFMLDVLSPPERTKLLSTITTPEDRARFTRGVQAAEAAGYYQRSDLPR
jgi:hypothetical protein